MLKISAGPFISVTTNQGYDPYGQPELELMVEGSQELTQMQVDLVTLRARLDTLVTEQETEARLRAEHPALKELHDQYKIVYTLVKNADVNVGNDGNR